MGKPTKSATSRWIKSPADEHAADNGCFFDEPAAKRVVEFFERFLRHSKGQWAGQPFSLTSKRENLPPAIMKAIGEVATWQRDDVIMPLFGWKRKNGFRRFREGFIDVPRKNGKSTLLSGTGNYMLFGDQEPGAHVYCAACDRDQAAIVYEEARNMVEASPELIKYAECFRHTISVLRSKSMFKVISADARRKHGFNSHCNIIDELHAHTSRELLDVLLTGTSARRQPLTLSITTAGFDRHSICFEKYDYAKKLAKGVVFDDSFFQYIAEAPDDADWKDPLTWAKANPNIGVSKFMDYLADECRKAQELPSYENTFKRLELNIWTQQDSRFISSDAWAACGGVIDERELTNVPCYGGLDLSTTIDITAFVLVFLTDPVSIVCRFWIPEDSIQQRVKRDRVPYDVWARQGVLSTTPGNVIDYDFIKAEIHSLKTIFDIQEIGYDPWRATQIAVQLEADGVKMVPVRQGYATMSEPTKELQKLIVGQQINHGNHPVLNWMADNLIVTQDAAGNLKPDRSKNIEKIDGMVALINALDRMTRNANHGSVYETRGVLAL